jgi:hypothetical protein
MLSEKIKLIQSAPNMVEIEGLLSSVTAHYLCRYANEVQKAPAPDGYGSQSNWIEKAVRFFIADIHRDKLVLWQHIHPRFHKTAIYQRLAVSQFVTDPAI